MLERLLPSTLVEKRGVYAFLLGLCLSVIGIGLSLLIFPKNPALVSVAFTSILLIPEIKNLLSREEEFFNKKKFIGLKIYSFTKTYLLMLFGIFLTYALASVFLDSMSASILFREQMALRGAATGLAVGEFGILNAILANNAIVLIACFFIAFLTGDGGVFLLTWNASVWGTIFGVTAKNAALMTSKNPFSYLLIILVIVLPHAFLEITSYVLSSLSGGILSDTLIGKAGNNRVMSKSIKIAFLILGLAICFLLVGVVVESFVLESSGLYRTIIMQSFGFA